MIQGYLDQSSAFPSDTITLRVSCRDAPQFRIVFYRQGPRFEFVASSRLFSGQPADERSNWEDWSLFWPGYQFELPDDWSPGAYVAIFVEGDGNDSPNPNQDPPIDFSTPDARSGKALVGKYVNEWEQVRPKEQLPALDKKTSELVHFLFFYRERRISRSFINLSLIPLLCRKAGVPEQDSRRLLSPS